MDEDDLEVELGDVEQLLGDLGREVPQICQKFFPPDFGNSGVKTCVLFRNLPI